MLGISTSPLVVLAVTAVIGIPYVLVLISITQSLYVAAPPDQEGQAAGLFQTARSLGCIGSTVVVGLSFAGGTSPVDWMLLAAITGALGVLYLLVVMLWRTRRPAAPAAPSPGHAGAP